MHFDLSKTAQHQLYNLIIGLVAPRPIAWITSHDSKGKLNAAPFSAFNYMGIEPPVVSIGIANRPNSDVKKDTAQNIHETKEFVVNIVNESMAEKMVLTAVDFPHDMSEVEVAGLKTSPSLVVKVPRLADAPASLECREIMTLQIGQSNIVLGQVVAIYLNDSFYDSTHGYVKADQMHAIGRMNGGGHYVRTRDAFFEIPRTTYEEWRKQRK